MNPELLTQEGNDLYENEEYPEAIEKYRQATEIQPDFPEAWSGWGKSLYQLTKYDEAIGLLKKAITLKSNLATAHDYLGRSYAGLHQYNLAFVSFEKAIDIEPDNSDCFFIWGYTLGEIGRYQEAIDITKKSITEKNGPTGNLDAYHNIAEYLWMKGAYEIGREKWDEVIEMYASNIIWAIKEKDDDFFFYYASTLYNRRGDLDLAESVFLKGLSVAPDEPSLLIGLGELYLERHLNSLTVSGYPSTDKWHQLAFDNFEKAKTILQKDVKKPTPIVSSLHELGDLFVIMEEFELACENLTVAYSIDPEDADICDSLGVAYSMMGNYPKAQEYFEKAHRLRPRDLDIWSNLGEVYLKLSQNDRAEREFLKILRISNCHVDTLIGLGETYTLLADTGDEELYELAIKQYDSAIQLAQSNRGSTRIKLKNLATIYYARGYAKVKLSESKDFTGSRSLLKEAYEDFANCYRNDTEHHKGKRAKNKIAEKLRNSRQHLFVQKVAPWLSFAPIFVFIAAQVKFYVSENPIDSINYGVLTFGSLMFTIVCLLLPQVQKLKGAGIELEKTQINQISTSGSLNIRK